MGAYQTLVVGTDGSETSLRAVSRAGEIAAAVKAKLVIAIAYFPHSPHIDEFRAAEILKGDGYKMQGDAAIYAILREARDRAKAAGATDIEERPIRGLPVQVLLSLAEEVNANLLVVGSVGLGTMRGRLLGSIPANLSGRAKTDVLIVHTTS